MKLNKKAMIALLVAVVLTVAVISPVFAAGFGGRENFGRDNFGRDNFGRDNFGRDNFGRNNNRKNTGWKYGKNHGKNIWHGKKPVKVEKKPTTNPKTADFTNIALWATLLPSCAAGFVLTNKKARKVK
ncbi:MAG: sortase B protein-sorting domain-containing protein [Eubacteriaceae bacterium]|nr:sortase B protein-sorting domain-containing protein [Eubacteriaceae bacterium]